jgi:iron complex transport system ATP-binding protein
MVTHHVEEIPVGFTHALLLADGSIQSAGSIDEVITAENLSTAFGLTLSVTNDGGRFTARAA